MNRNKLDLRILTFFLRILNLNRKTYERFDVVAFGRKLSFEYIYHDAIC